MVQSEERPVVAWAAADHAHKHDEKAITQTSLSTKDLRVFD